MENYLYSKEISNAPLTGLKRKVGVSKHWTKSGNIELLLEVVFFTQEDVQITGNEELDPNKLFGAQKLVEKALNRQKNIDSLTGLNITLETPLSEGAEQISLFEYYENMKPSDLGLDNPTYKEWKAKVYEVVINKLDLEGKFN